MNNTQLEGFKEELVKEANKFKGLKDGAMGIVEKVKKNPYLNPAEAKRNIAAAEGAQHLPEAVKSLKKNKNIIKGQKAVAGTAAAGATGYTGYRAIKGPEKKAFLAKEAAGKMQAAYQGLKEIATGKQMREGASEAGRVFKEHKRKGFPTATAAEDAAFIEGAKNLAKGTAKTVGLYGGAGATVGAGTYGVNRLRSND